MTMSRRLVARSQTIMSGYPPKSAGFHCRARVRAKIPEPATGNFGLILNKLFRMLKPLR